jgi:DNA primase small subunit
MAGVESMEASKRKLENDSEETRSSQTNAEDAKRAAMQMNAGPQLKNSDYSRELLRVYYDRFFPFQHMFRWLSYKNDPKSSSKAVEKDFFLRREFTLVLEGDIYCRYTCFRDVEEYRSQVIARQPVRMEIGAVYTHPPKNHHTVIKDAYKPLERELVFDIDMDDYDDIRTCCQGANLCSKCWTFMKAAIKILDRALREDFGFKHFVFVYSGRRGVHCWVCDKTARRLPNDQRSAIADYLTLVAGGTNRCRSEIKFSGDQIHPSIQSAYEIGLEYFRDDPEGVLKGQDILRKGPHLDRILDSFGPSERSSVESYMKDNPTATSADIWRRLEKLQEERETRSVGIRERKQASVMLKEIVVQYSSPRLDVNVSKQMNHLLKSPFVVHPKTGRVCVPINIATVDDFDPRKVPTVGLLVEELTRGQDAKNSSLKPYTHFFDVNFLQPLEAACAKEMNISGGLDF